MAWPTRLKRALLAWLLLACCLPAFAATDWPHWQAELVRLHQDAIPRDEVRRRFIELQKTLPPDPPYPVQREAARVALPEGGWRAAEGSGFSGRVEGGEAALPPFQALFAEPA